MDHQGSSIEGLSFLLSHGDSPLSLYARKPSDRTQSPDTKSWLTDMSDLSGRSCSESPSLYSVPSTCSTQDFPLTPTSFALRLPQVPIVPAIRHRTPQACDKCRERKTKCSGDRPTCLRCKSRGLTCNYSARETRIRSARPLAQTFNVDGRPLFDDTMKRKTDPFGFPTPAHHSRLGSCQTNAFTRIPNAPKAPIMPIYTTVPVTRKRFMEAFDSNEDLVQPPLPISFRGNKRPRPSPDSNSDRVRKPLRTSLQTLETSLFDDHSYDQIPQIDLVSMGQEFNLDYPQLNRRRDVDYLPTVSKDAGQEIPSPFFGHPPVEGQIRPDFNEDFFSLYGDFSLSWLSFAPEIPHPAFDFLNGPDIFC